MMTHGKLCSWTTWGVNEREAGDCCLGTDNSLTGGVPRSLALTCCHRKWVRCHENLTGRRSQERVCQGQLSTPCVLTMSQQAPEAGTGCWARAPSEHCVTKARARAGLLSVEHSPRCGHSAGTGQQSQGSQSRGGGSGISVEKARQADSSRRWGGGGGTALELEPPAFPGALAGL